MMTAIENMNTVREQRNAARDNYLATGQGGEQVFCGVTVKVNALYFLMKQAEQEYNIADTDASWSAYQQAQKNYYRAGGI